MNVNIPGSYRLSGETLRLVILETITPFFQTYPYVIDAWNFLLVMRTSDPNYTDKGSESFDLLFKLITTTINNNHLEPTKKNVEKIINEYASAFFEIVIEIIQEEFPSEHISYSLNKGLVEQAKQDRAIQTSYDMDLFLMRDAVTKGPAFKEKHKKNLPTIVELQSNQGKHRLKARYEENDNSIQYDNDDEQKQWDNLVHHAFNSMDEMTADMFDIACFLSMYAPKDEYGFFEFHYNDAAILRNSSHIIKSNPTDEKVPKKLKDDLLRIMQRIAALSKIWISIKEGEIIEADNIQELNRYKYKDWSKMFEVGRVRIIYDEDDNPLGIYAIQIKPTSLLTPYLEKSKSQGLIDLTALEFHPYWQKYEKRLTRYLATIWFWGNKKPIQVENIIDALSFTSSFNGIDKYEKLLFTLTNLKGKDIIEEFSWIDGEIKKDEIGVKGWFSRFLELRIKIVPSKQMLEKNRAKLKLLENQKDFDPKGFQKIIEKLNYVSDTISNQQQKEFNEILTSLDMNDNNSLYNTLNSDTIKKMKEVNLHSVKNNKSNFRQLDLLDKGISQDKHNTLTVNDLTGEMIAKERKRRKLSLRKLAYEIGDISANTIRRFEKNMTSKTNNDNAQKLLDWYLQSKNIN